MPYPTIYAVTYSYTGFQQAQGNNAFPGAQIDVDFAGLQASVSSLALFVTGALRSDGQLNNGLVTFDSLSASLQTAGLSPAANWLTATFYAAGKNVLANGNLYRSLIAHTSGVFATDIAAAKWILVAALPIGPQGPSGTMAVNSTATLAAGAPATVVNVGTAQAASLNFGIPQGIQGIQGITGAGYGGTSATSLLIANAVTKVFVTQAGLAYQVGNYVRASSAANGANFMEGTVSAYAGTSLSIAVTKIGGAGTFADWAFAIAGAPGTGDLLSTNNLSDVTAKYTAKDNITVHGADIASAATVNLETATGDLVDVTGVVAITAITLNDGHERTVRFTGILTLTNGASLVLPGGANITTAAGDLAVFRGYAAGVVRCVEYTKASGKPVIANTAAEVGAVSLTTTSQAFTGGINPTEFDNGTKTTGTFTPEAGNGPLQKYTNNGAHTLAAGTGVGEYTLRVTNGASAGAITFSGFDKQFAGDALAITNALQYDIFIKVTGKKTYFIRALQ